MNKKALLFDLDGTLIDSEKFYTDGTYEWMVELGFKGSREAIDPIVGTTMKETYAYLNTLLPDVEPQTLIARNQTYFNIEHPIPYKDLLFSDAKKYLPQFKKLGYYLGLCSLDTSEELKAFLKATFGFSFFDIVLSSDQVKNPKPHPEIWLKAMEELKVSPEETLIIEDSYNGICSAKASGALTWAREEKRFIRKQDDADYLFSDLAQLDAYLRSENGR